MTLISVCLKGATLYTPEGTPFWECLKPLAFFQANPILFAWIGGIIALIVLFRLYVEFDEWLQKRRFFREEARREAEEEMP
jgi:hypothetical protein